MFSESIDIITVYNNEKKYLDMVESLANSTFLNYRIIGLDNTTGKYTSAAAAYNHAISTLCSGGIYVFCHQDIIFDKDELQKIATLCSREPNTLFGAAGVKNQGPYRDTISSITDPWCQYATIKPNQLINVFSLDECLIAGNKQVFTKLQFNENLCNGWHFYGVEFCLRCHLNNISVKVYPSCITHLSPGKTDESFRDCEKRIAKEYLPKYRVLTYTCGWCCANKIDLVLLKIKHGISTVFLRISRKIGRVVFRIARRIRSLVNV